MASRKTWIVVGVLGVGLAALLIAAGATVFFVTRHIQTSRTTNADALRAFDEVRASFGGRRPLYELDQADEPRMVRPLSELPSSSSPPTTLWILAWDPNEERTVKLSVPFWILRMGKKKVSIVEGGTGFDLERLDLDVDELTRVGSALVFDFRGSDGVRALLWTQ